MAKTDQFFQTISHLINYQESDWDMLASEASEIKKWVPELIDTFYETLYELEETRTVFHDGERKKLEKTLELWLVKMLLGKQDKNFWDHQWYVALLHIKRGTKNLYMLGMMNRLQQLFLQKSIETFDSEKAFKVYSAFLRISGMVAGLIAQCYDEVVESSTRDGLTRVGLNEALISRIKDMQIKKMLDEVSMKK